MKGTFEDEYQKSMYISIHMMLIPWSGWQAPKCHFSQMRAMARVHRVDLAGIYTDIYQKATVFTAVRDSREVGGYHRTYGVCQI